MIGVPSIVSRGQEDVTVLLSGDLRHGPKKNPQAEHQMRRTIQDLVASIDPNVKILPEVEDVGHPFDSQIMMAHFTKAVIGDSRRVH